jgi:hypothetical protein
MDLQAEAAEKATNAIACLKTKVQYYPGICNGQEFFAKNEVALC